MTYKKHPFLVLASLMLATPVSAATVPVFDWVNTWGGTGSDSGSNVVFDGDENIYTVGRFNVTTDFDSSAGTAYATSSGEGDAYLLKSDPNGIFELVKTWGGSGDDTASLVSSDGLGGLVASGRFSNTVDLDPDVGTVFATSSGGYDMYLSRFDTDGVLEWSGVWGSTGSDVGAFVVPTFSDAVYVMSNFAGVIDFDPGVDTAFATSSGGFDMALSRFNSDGIFEWVKTWGGTGNEILGGSSSVGLDGVGGVYVLGNFSGTVDFDPSVSTTYATSSGSADAFVSKFDSDGTFEWVKTWGGTGSDGARGVFFDDEDNIYMIGSFANTVDFDPSAGTAYATSSGNADASLSKFDSEGTFEWVKAWGGTGNEFVENGAVNEGDVYVFGSFANTVDFDPSASTAFATSNGSDDAFVSRFNSEGTFEWVKTWGGTSSDTSKHMNFLDGKAFISGTFQNTADFDFSLGTENRTSAGSGDVYLLVLNLLEPAVTVSPTSDSLDEAGAGTFDYDLVLATPPENDVVITITPDVQVSVSTTSLTFASTTWDIAQTVTVSVVDDEENEDDPHTGVITHTAVSDDAAYDGITISSVTVSINENDSSGGGSSRSSVRAVQAITDVEPETPPPAVPLTPEQVQEAIDKVKQQLVAVLQQLIVLLQEEIAKLSR